MKARQRVQLTGTNRSFDLIALVAKATLLGSEHENALNKNRASARAGFALAFGCGRRAAMPKSQFCFTVLCRPGGPCKAIRPDPIPNSAVKRLSADGTLSQDMGE